LESVSKTVHTPNRVTLREEKMTHKHNTQHSEKRGSEGEEFTAGATIAEQISSKIIDDLKDKAQDVGEKWEDAGRHVSERIDGQREKAVKSLEKASETLHHQVNGSAGVIAKVVRTAAEKLQTSADYIRESDLNAMFDDIQGAVRKYPVQSIGVALVAGYFVGKVFSGNRA
jgi:ElaB/YqjD/DUF883 family membrane-anchored ribosome-binding protein